MACVPAPGIIGRELVGKELAATFKLRCDCDLLQVHASKLNLAAYSRNGRLLGYPVVCYLRAGRFRPGPGPIGMENRSIYAKGLNQGILHSSCRNRSAA
jgi:hypothetical protein